MFKVISNKLLVYLFSLIFHYFLYMPYIPARLDYIHLLINSNSRYLMPLLCFTGMLTLEFYKCYCYKNEQLVTLVTARLASYLKLFFEHTQCFSASALSICFPSIYHAFSPSSSTEPSLPFQILHTLQGLLKILPLREVFSDILS